jgi:hypothetical protein
LIGADVVARGEGEGVGREELSTSDPCCPQVVIGG